MVAILDGTTVYTVSKNTSADENLEVLWPLRTMQRRLEDRIKALCAKALTAHETELEAIILALRSALREHNLRLRKLVAAKLAGRLNQQPVERRSA